MKDLTEGAITGHLVRMAVPIGVGMVFQTLYYLVDLYFVAQLGDIAIAGVSAAGSLQFLVMALSQVLGVGTGALIAHAAGRKDREEANLIFNQSLGLAAVCAGLTLAGGYSLAGWYMQQLGADAATALTGSQYLNWFLPGMALQFALVSMGSALRGTGIVKPAILVQILTVLLNAMLCPILITGWLTGWPLGVVGAGLATSISVGVGVVLMFFYFLRLERFVAFDFGLMRPRGPDWKRILAVGLPPGGEFALMFVFIGVIYWTIRGFGPEAQAGYGIGQRVVQALILPAMAIAFATAPVAGQNMGAGKFERVRATFKTAMVMLVSIMLSLTLVFQVHPEAFIAFFTSEPQVIAAGAQFLRIISFNFVAVGVVFTCSGLFQAMGNTLPALAASASRLLSFAIPAVWLSSRPWFELHHLWYLSVATVALQAMISWLLAIKEMNSRLAPNAA